MKSSNRVSSISLRGLFTENQENQLRDQNNIHGAVVKKDHKELKLLLNKSNFNEINSRYFGESALDIAVRQGDHVSVELLLTYGAIPDYKRSRHVWPESTFAKAILGGNLKVIKLLVNHGCDPDTKLKVTKPSWQYMLEIDDLLLKPDNYWYKIIELDDLLIFQTLLECKGRKIGNDAWSQRILLLACALASSIIVKYLLDQGISVESTDDNNGWTCVFYAVACESITIFWILINQGANLKHRDFEGRTLFHIAASHYNSSNTNIRSLEELILLLNCYGLDINATDNKGVTPIMFAFDKKKVEERKIQVFLDQPGIDLNLFDNDGKTIMHRVVQKSDRKLFWTLLNRHDIDINARDRWGRTLLYNFPVNLGSLHYFMLLIEFGVDTKDLHKLNEDISKDEFFLKALKNYQLKRSIANLSKDQNIETLLAPHCVFPITEPENFVEIYSKEIERMKETILCDQLTYYDFLHAKKRTCIHVAKKPHIKEMLNKFESEFFNYKNMLFKKYLSGARPLTAIESEAMILADENLDYICNYKLPNLVIYNIKKYIDLEDLVTLNNTVKLFDSSDNVEEECMNED